MSNGLSWVAVALFALLGCREPASAPALGVESPVEVGVITIESRAVPLSSELPGRTVAFELSEVRPQVSGIVTERLFREGERVEKGQALFQIDAALYRAAVDLARANRESALAAQEAADAKVERYAMLFGEHVVSEQDWVEARMAARQARATVEQARAQLSMAETNLRYTRLVAPIAGRIGRSLVSAGALVTSGQAEPLAVIQRLDPMYVDLQQASAAVLELRRGISAGQSVPSSADVALRLEDGSTYPRSGTLNFTEAAVDATTGAVTLRASFTNPDGLLLPGMFVRATIVQAEHRSAVLAPQPSVSRDAKGNAHALVVDAEGKVDRRELQLARPIGDQWLVERGLAPGERVIVEGVDKVKPGQTVRAVPALARREEEAAPALAPATGPT